MDWLDDFKKKYGADDELKDLKAKGFYGHITINFFKGEVADVNKYQTRKPAVK